MPGQMSLSVAWVFPAAAVYTPFYTPFYTLFVLTHFGQAKLDAKNKIGETPLHQVSCGCRHSAVAFCAACMEWGGRASSMRSY